MGRISDNEKFILDVHGLTIREVDTMLNKLIWDLDIVYKEVEIIHGFNYGTALREHLRNDYFNSKIDRILYFENPGRTSLFLIKAAN